MSLAQQHGRFMAGDQSISWLMFFTFGATIFIIAGAFIYFLRRRSNREIASDTLVGDVHTSRTPLSDGALPDLLSLIVFAFIAMGLLSAGYASKTRNETNQPMPPVGGQMPTDRK